MIKSVAGRLAANVGAQSRSADRAKTGAMISTKDVKRGKKRTACSVIGWLMNDPGDKRGLRQKQVIFRAEAETDFRSPKLGCDDRRGRRGFYQALPRWRASI